MATENEVHTVRRSAVFGMVSILVFVSVCLLCIHLDGTWRPYNMICSLGTSDSMLVRALFTVNCVVSGIGFILCGYGIMKGNVREFLRMAYILTVCVGLFLILIGVFDMDTEVHEGFAFGVALMMGVAMGAMFIDDVLRRRYVPAVILLVISAGLLYVFFGLPEYGQSISLATMLSWSFIRMVMLYRSADVFN